MFTGLIQAVGKVVKYDGRRLWIHVPFKKLQHGESISVDGVCLTVTARKGSIVQFDVGPETRRITTLGKIKKEARVNLERALRFGDALGGHWVTGHVEERGRLVSIERDGSNAWFHVQVPKTVSPYILHKGSLAVDGVSLTVASIRRGKVSLMIIPYTLSHTTLRFKKPGDRVNLEADILAKYSWKKLQKLWPVRLKKRGW
jgi:riboflavin synthase